MARKKKQLPLLENVLITGIAAEGKALAKVNDVVVFVPFAIPGDVVNLQVTKKKSSFMEARIISFVLRSPHRVEPLCPHYGVCGGCKWQALPYPMQLQHKQTEVLNNLTRIGKVELPETLPILGSAQTERYRNKLEFTFSNRRWRTAEEMAANNEPDTMNAVGFHIPGMFDKVLDIHQCHLQDNIQNRIRNEIRTYALQHGLTFFDLRTHEGFLRTMMVRTTSTGEVMLIMVFYYDDAPLRNQLLGHLAAKFPEITSLLYIINNKANDTITDREVHTYHGNDFIIEHMEGLRFKIGAKSFYQTNSEQACQLYKVARRFAALTGNELVYDLYTGTGTIANFVARHARKVIGIEYVPEAIEDAKANSALNDINNTLFFAGDMKEVLNAQFIATHGQPDVIITDPPRAGMHTDVIDAIRLAKPARIVYVSCNSATQARDLQLLADQYRVTAVQPVDMFPHTHHVENVVLLQAK